jgi:hypothetical protein
MAGMPVLGSHEDRDQVVNRMREFVSTRFQTMIDDLGPDAIWEQVCDKKGLAGVLVHVMTGVSIRTQLGVVPAPIGFLRPIKLEFSPTAVPTRFTDECKAMLEMLNRGLRVL